LKQKQTILFQFWNKCRGLMIRLLLTVLLVLSLQYVDGQTVYFRHYEIESGLSNNSVIAILQDKDGFLWFGTPDGLNRFDGYEFKLFRFDQEAAQGSASNAIFCLHQDAEGTLWVGASKGLYYYNPKDETFSRLSGTQGKWVRNIQNDTDNNIWFVENSRLYKYVSSSDTVMEQHPAELGNITTLYRDGDNILWMGSANGILARLDPRSNSSDYFHAPAISRKTNTIEAICAADNNTLLIGTSLTGLKRFDVVRHTWSTVPLMRGAKDEPYVRCILRVAPASYWVGTESGLFILGADSIRHFYKVTGDSYSLSDNAVYALCQDQEGGIWAGTYFGGINYYPNHLVQFEKFFPRNDGVSIRGSVVREIVQDQYGMLWIGTEDKGLSRFNPVTHRFTNCIDSKGSLGTLPTNIHGLMADRDRLYIGTFENGLYIVDLRTQAIVQHHVAHAGNGLNSNYINILYKTRKGDIWVCTSNSIYIFDPVQKRFNLVPGLPEHTFYSAFLEDDKGRIWIGTHDNGVFCVENGNITPLRIPYNGGTLFNETRVVNFLVDRDSILWVCTVSGLFRVSLPTQQVRAYNTATGLPGDMVYSAIQDTNGNIWATTSKGLALIDTAHRLVKVFRKSDGLLSNQFNHRSAFKDAEGNIYLGGLKGFVRFNPGRMNPGGYVPPVFFTRLRVYDKEVSTNSPYTFSENYILNSNQITLPHNRATFSLDFASLGYTAPDNIEYAYMLDGVDNNWNFIGKNRRIHFNNLSPGTYVIKIKSTDSDGDWMANEKSLTVEITPPFWRTKLAYMIYVVLLVTLIYCTARFFYNRNREKQVRRMEIFTLNKEKELYQQKIDFFTRVAHEIRTPLTLIKAPMDKIFKSVERIPDIRREVEIMNKNTDRLLTLTNQLLDFQKVESGSYMLHTEPRDIVAMVKEVYQNFQPKAEKRGIQYVCKTPDGPVVGNVDADGIFKIIGNLLDNAIKYCQSYTLLEVYTTLGKDGKEYEVVIKVSNDGKIIPEEERVYIFDAFYSAGRSSLFESTGIGLSLARSIALLHKGSLEYSTDGKFNIFNCVIPVA